MQWIWKNRKPVVSVTPIEQRDWQQLYEVSLGEIRDLRAENIRLYSAEADLKLWIERICTLIPQMRLRSDREQPVIKAQLGLLLAEAQEKGWTEKL